MKLDYHKIIEEIFMKEIWDSFTVVGRVTLFPIIFILGYGLIICMIPLIPFILITNKIEPKLDPIINKTRRFIRRIFIKVGY